MKPVRLAASATHLLPRWGLFLLCMLYILPGLIGRDPWKNDDAAGFGIMWTLAHGGLDDWLLPHIAGLPVPEEGPLAFWIGALCIKLFGWLVGDVVAARIATFGFFLLGLFSIWHATYLLGRRTEAQPLKLAFGGQPEPKDYGRTLADGALLIYLGSLGLLSHSHSTTAEALQISLVAFSVYAAVRVFETCTMRTAMMLGTALGLLALTRGWIVPLGLLLGLLVLTGVYRRKLFFCLAAVVFPVAVIVVSAWPFAGSVLLPYGRLPADAWMAWNYDQLSWPSLDTLKYFLKYGVWLTWPAWPYAGWAIYAWRKQYTTLHIALPFTFFVSFALLALCNPNAEEGILLPLIPPLAILAAFGLPTMKRGAINAVDWFAVMTLTTCAAFIWIAWVAKQTGWPAQLAKNAFKLAPGFKPEFNVVALLIALLVSAGWIILVHWRISRRPSVLWRAGVLSSGGVILCWLLLMTLWLPWGNYVKSYAAVARQIASKVPASAQCVDTNVGPGQRASFAYYGQIPFAEFQDRRCDFLLLQNRGQLKVGSKLFKDFEGQWQLIWEGRRASDRDERFRLYRRVN